MHATVIGGGVSGLTAALVLREHGWDVGIVTRDTYESTVSSVAAAVWTVPSGEPASDMRHWAMVSHSRFGAAADVTDSGVHRLRLRELERHDPGPTWWETQPMVRRLEPSEVPDGYAAGFEIDGFIAEPAQYLAWLTGRLSASGVAIDTADVRRLEDVDGDLVVNCSGLGAALLAGDDELTPIRGHVVIVANPGISGSVSDESDPGRIAYVYPRPTEVVLGGTRQRGCVDTDPDPAETERILTDTARLDPRLVGAQLVGARVGLRPGRPAVRVERDRLDDGRPVIHDYGHGGQGFILSWGCAEDVATLAGSP